MIPWRTILFLVALVFFVCFAGFNLNNTSSISLGFFIFKDIPIFISLSVAFIIGAFVMLPFRMKRKPGARSEAAYSGSRARTPGKQSGRKQTRPTVDLTAGTPDDGEL